MTAIRWWHHPIPVLLHTFHVSVYSCLHSCLSILFKLVSLDLSKIFPNTSYFHNHNVLWLQSISSAETAPFPFAVKDPHPDNPWLTLASFGSGHFARDPLKRQSEPVGEGYLGGKWPEEPVKLSLLREAWATTLLVQTAMQWKQTPPLWNPEES